MRSRRRRLLPWIGLVGAALSGCSLAPAYERPALPVSDTYPAGSEHEPAPEPKLEQSSVAAADIGWRDFLIDARLARLVEIALGNNRDLRVATLQVAQAQALYRVQRSALLPQLDMSASKSESRTPVTLSAPQGRGPQDEYSVGANIAWELDFFGRLQNLSAAAQQRYLATAHARTAAEILLISQVVNQYLAMLAVDELLAVTRRTLDTADASLRLTSLQLANGVGNELFLQQSLSVVEQAKASYAAQLRTRAQAENALVLLIGQPLPEDLPPATPLDAQTILADIPAGLPSDLLMRRPDIREAEANLLAANADIGAARAAFFPFMTLTGSYRTASTTLSGLFDSGSRAWSFIPSIVAPIFHGGELRANLDLAKLQKDSAIAQYEKAIQTAFREVADNLAARETYDEEVSALESLTEAQRRTLDLAQMRFRSGVDTYLDVLTAQTSFYSAQQSLVSARLERLTTLVDLYRSLGGGWAERTVGVQGPAAGAN